jgi:SAM-dependent methyltransferase
MSKSTRNSGSEFDAYAADYDAALAMGVSVSGEDKDYFAHGRIAHLGRCLERLGRRPAAVMDFGCGTGSAAPYLTAMRGVDSVIGVDVSERSIERARVLHGATGVRFATAAGYQPHGAIDLAFCNGVFHHVPPSERGAAVDFVSRSLAPDGLFALWENNPWNPGTRYVMSRIPFDRDAIMLSAFNVWSLLRAHGFEIIRTDFLFVFPRALGWLRPAEDWITKLPLGAQFQVLGRKILT